MPLITDSEMEDFEATIINAGFEVDDFGAVLSTCTGRKSLTSNPALTIVASKSSISLAESIARLRQMRTAYYMLQCPARAGALTLLK